MVPARFADENGATSISPADAVCPNEIVIQSRVLLGRN